MMSDLIKRQKNDMVRDITSLGSLFFYVFIMALFLFMRQYITFKRLLIGLAILYIITITFRSILFKDRPKKIKYDSYVEKLDASSFPSLHASRTTYMAIILTDFFNNIIISILLLLFVAAISYSRIYLKKHDWKDVLGGIVVAVLVYFISVQSYQFP